MEIKTLEQYAVLRIEQLEVENEKLKEEKQQIIDKLIYATGTLDMLKKSLKHIGTHEYNAIYGEPVISFDSVTNKYDSEDYTVLARVIARSDENDKGAETEASKA